MVEQERNNLVDGRRLDDMIVVQDEDERLRGFGDVVDQAGEQRFKRGLLGGLQYRLGCLTKGWVDSLERGKQVSQEPCRIVVTVIEGEPGSRPVHLTKPVTQERCFAKACRRRGEGQPVTQTQSCVQPLDEMWSWHQIRAWRRDKEFGCQ